MKANHVQRCPFQLVAVFICIFFQICVAGNANCQSVSESFDYPVAAALNQQGGGLGFISLWGSSPNYNISSASLSDQSGRLSTSANRVTGNVNPTSPGTNNRRSLATPLGAPGTIKYISFLIRPEGTLHNGWSGGYYGMDINGLFVGKPGNPMAAGTNYALEKAGGSNRVLSNVAPVLMQTAFLIIKCQFYNGNDIFTLYVNPTPGGSEPVSGTVKNDLDVGTVSQILISSSAQMSFDELRIGDSYASVTSALFEQGELTVTGRVLNAQANAALAGASVTLFGRNTTSASNGSFTFANVSLASGITLSVGAPGFLAQTRTVMAAAGVKAVNVGDIALAPNTDKPVVEWVKLENPKGVYLRGLPTGLQATLSRPTAKTRVNWNGTTPGAVEFRVNGTLVGTQMGSGPEYSLVVPVDTYFPPSPSTHFLKIVAKAAGGAPVSEAKPLEVHVITPHRMIQGLLGAAASGPGSLELDFEFPLKTQSITLPVIGKYGCDMALGVSFDYTYEDGSWELALGVSDTAQQGKRATRPVIPGLTRYPKPKLYIGNKEIESSLYGVAKGSSLYDPFVIDQVRVNASIGWKGELTRYTIADLALPGIGTLLGNMPGSEKLLNNFSVIFWLKVNGDGSVLFKPVWPVDLDDATLDTTIGVEASYEPSASAKIHAKIYAGGEGNLKVGTPSPIFREAGCRVYFGLEAEAWFLSFNREWVIVEYTWTPGRRLLLNAMQDIGTGYLVAGAGNPAAAWQPMARPWRDKGAEIFLLAEGPARRLDETAAAALDTYARMEAAPAPGAIYAPAAGPGRRIASNPALPAQAVLPLLQNVFPNSEPALAARAANQMLLYVRDTGVANPVHFTEVAWTRFNGTSWSTPAPVSDDVRGQFAPQVAFDGNGAAVAVWERIKEAAFSASDLGLAAAQMELVTAKWDPTASTWSAVTALTDNAHVDHSTQLAGPLAGGDLILTWRENPSNLLIGTASGISRILTRRWDAATTTWGAAQVLVDNLSGELSVSLTAAGSKAVLLLSRDMDNDLATTGDTELFHCFWNESTSTWSAPTRYTNDGLADRNAKVCVDSGGQVYALWQRGSELVMDRNLAGTPGAVRTDAATAGFADFSLALSPSGNVVALWQEMTDFGSDAHYRVFDPASNTWGLDTLLSQDSDLERSFATAWDNMGNLVLAYDNVTVTKQNKIVALEGGGTVEVTGVPQPGQVDLNLAKRALVKDLTLSANGFTASGTTYLPGDAITLKAKVKNSGNVAVENVPVSFYDGDPAAGGTLIQSVTLPGWLKAADEAEATINWTIPTPAIARTVFVKVDPAGIVSEASETNNTLSLPLNGVDLELEYVSGNVLPDGSARVVAKVKSLSAPDSPVTMLRLWRKDGATALTEVNVSQLAPGDSVEIPLDLPAGSQSEGVQAYRLILDEEALTGDVDPSNNEVLFSLNLWIDDDGDGIPHDWEITNGMRDDNADDANPDIDGDGFTAKQEYLAGTNPQNSASALKIGEVARQSTPDGLSTLVSWSSVAGRSYRLERSYDLDNWQVVQDNVAATPPLNTVVDGDLPPAGKAFYRLVISGQ